MLGPRGQELAGRAAHQAGTLPPVTAKARRPLRLQLQQEGVSSVGVPGHESRAPPCSSGVQVAPSASSGRSGSSAERLNVSPDSLLIPRDDVSLSRYLGLNLHVTSDPPAGSATLLPNPLPNLRTYDVTACSKPFHWLPITFQMEFPQYGPQPFPRCLPHHFLDTPTLLPSQEGLPTGSPHSAPVPCV